MRAAILVLSLSRRSFTIFGGVLSLNLTRTRPGTLLLATVGACAETGRAIRSRSKERKTAASLLVMALYYINYILFPTSLATTTKRAWSKKPLQV